MNNWRIEVHDNTIEKKPKLIHAVYPLTEENATSYFNSFMKRFAGKRYTVTWSEKSAGKWVVIKSVSTLRGRQ